MVRIGLAFAVLVAGSSGLALLDARDWPYGLLLLGFTVVGGGVLAILGPDMHKLDPLRRRPRSR